MFGTVLRVYFFSRNIFDSYPIIARKFAECLFGGFFVLDIL